MISNPGLTWIFFWENTPAGIYAMSSTTQSILTIVISNDSGTLLDDLGVNKGKLQAALIASLGIMELP